MGKGFIPSIIKNNKFNEEGFVEVREGKLLVPAYVASQFGFHKQGREFLEKFYEELEEKADILALCPFRASLEYLTDEKNGPKIRDKTDIKGWRKFNEVIPQINYEILIPKSKLMVVLLDGGHAIDDGVSAEIGYYAGMNMYFGNSPIIGIRSDLRLSENIEAPINVAVSYFMQKKFNGELFTGEEAYGSAIKRLKEISYKLTR